MDHRLVAASLLLVLSVTTIEATTDPALLSAVKHGDAAAVAAALKRKVDVNAPLADGATALHWAALRDDHRIVDLLIGAGANVNAANEYGVTPMALAAENGSAPMIERLLKAGGKANVAASTGGTPLQIAARVGARNAVKILVAHGADVNAREATRGQTALMWAVWEQHPDVVQLLIELGADVHARSADPPEFPIVRAFQAITPVESLEIGGFTALMFAAREGHVPISEMLIAAGARVNDTATDGVTPLVVASVRGHLALAKFLLEHGADPNLDKAGYTALHWAAGAWETNLTGPFGLTDTRSEWTGLAGLKGPARLEFVKLLLKHGANPNLRFGKEPPFFFGLSSICFFDCGATLLGRLRLAGATPFWLAAQAADVAVMRALLDAGADPKISTLEDTTPLMAAAGLGRIVGESLVDEPSALEAVRLLIELGADVNATSNIGDTALHAAAWEGMNSLVQALVDRGARLDAKNKYGETPMSVADGFGRRVAGTNVIHPKTAELLRKLAAERKPGVK